MIAGAAAVVVVILVGVAIAVANLPSRNGDVASPNPTTAATSVATVDELLGHIPSDYRDSCQPTQTDLRGAAVKLECPITGSKVSMLQHYQYDNQDAYDRAVSAAMTQTTSSDCSTGPGQDPYRLTTSGGEERSGILACQGTAPVITFTSSTDQLRVISIAKATYDYSFGYPEMKGSWNEYPLE